MQISFFEEFPTKRNLNKLSLVDFPTKLYLAASSFDEFLKLKNEIIQDYQLKDNHKKFTKNSNPLKKINLKNEKSKNPKNSLQIKEFIYWPILTKREGYWISPFTKRKALLRIFKELENTKSSVMLDLELPTTKNTSLYLTQFFNFLRNKYLIKKFIKNHPKQVYLAEYFPIGMLKIRLLQSIGLHFKQAKVIKMLYHSMLPFGDDFFRKELELGTKYFENDYLAGFGTIAKGIMGWEKILSPAQLKKDLINAKRAKVEEVIIFRLGGLNQSYLRVLKEI